ncbi:MAG TPA: phospholipid carrier-dependent glycosyltransferase [Thermomicrobiales bacterium]
MLPPTLALFLVLAGVYLLTSGGHTYSYDEETMFGLTISLVERGSLVVPTCPGCAVLRSIPMPEGRNYSRYGPLQSIVAIPPYLLGRALASGDDAATWVGTRYAATLLTALVTAAIGALLYTLIRRVGYSHRTALVTALLYGFGTQAWPRAKTFFADPLTTLLILGAVYCWWRLDQPSARDGSGAAVARWAVGIALCCGLAVGVKFGAGIILPVFGLAGAASLWRRWRRDELRLRELIPAAVAAAATLAILLALVGLYNWVRFASPFETGYGGREVGAVQQGNWREALPGLLISPGKGLFIFSPIVILGLLSFWRFARHAPRLAVLVGTLVVEHVAFYARVPQWDAGTSWGPRYLDFIVPLLVLPLAAGLAWLAAPERARGVRLALGGFAGVVIALALVVQLLGVLVNFDTGYNLITTGRRYWTVANSPPLVHARILSERVGGWWAIRFPSQDQIVPARGIPVTTEVAPIWPRYLPQEAALRVHANGDAPLIGTLLYDDARERQEPPARFVVLIDGRAVATTGPNRAPEIGPHAYRLTFTMREAGASASDFTLTIRNAQFASLGPSWTLAVTVATDGRELPTVRRPLLLPFPDDDPERWAWFFTERNQHLVDLWPWYIAILPLPSEFAYLLYVGVGGGSIVALFVGSLGLALAGRRQRRARHC